MPAAGGVESAADEETFVLQPLLRRKLERQWRSWRTASLSSEQRRQLEPIISDPAFELQSILTDPQLAQLRHSRLLGAFCAWVHAQCKYHDILHASEGDTRGGTERLQGAQRLQLRQLAKLQQRLSLDRQLLFPSVARAGRLGRAGRGRRALALALPPAREDAFHRPPG